MIRRLLAASCLVSVSCGGGTEPEGTLGALPDSLIFASFFAQPAAISLDLNGVGGEVSWTASGSAAWLSVTPASGRTPSSPSVEADPSGMAGTQAAALTVSGGGASFQIPVRLTLPSVAGTWNGSIPGIVFQLVLTQSGATIAGRGAGTQGGITDSITISGQQSHPQVGFTLNITGFQPFTFTGAFSSNNSLNGVLNGSGFNSTSIQLTRLP